MSLRRYALSLGGPFLLLALGGCSPAPEPRWNVLLLTLDTTRADFLGCYGAPQGASPHLDALARSGTRFDQAISSAAVTPVSHASILTGLDNAHHGLRVLAAGSGFRLPDEVPTLATVLHEHGWRTGAVHSAFPVSAHFGFRRGYDRFESFEPESDPAQAVDLVGKYQRRSDATTDLALDFVRGSDTPFFLWVHYWDPHDAARVPPPEWLPADLPRTSEGAPLPTRELYAAEVRYLDAQIGRLLDGLAQLGRAERTLVVVVADHGEGLGDHGWSHHRILYQEQVRVPLVVRVPGAQQKPVVPELVRSIDIFPTLLDYLGLAAPRPVDGLSLRALIEGRPDAPRSAYCDQINGYDTNAAMLRHRPLDDFDYAVIDAGWKLVYRPNHPDASELFDLQGDPREQVNRWANAPEQRLRLLRLLAAHAAWVTQPFASGAAGSSGTNRALDALGYVAGDEDSGPVAWAWTCPEHAQELSLQRRNCPRCGGAPLLVRKP